MPTPQTLEALRQAAEGLTYQSETDAPWEAFAWPTAKGIPTADGVRKEGRHKPDSPVEEQAVDEFFKPLTEELDWYGDEEKAVAVRYVALGGVVKQQLSDPKVFKVGERKLAVYIVGQVKEGGWAGLKTTAVET